MRAAILRGVRRADMLGARGSPLSRCADRVAGDDAGFRQRRRGRRFSHQE